MTYIVRIILTMKLATEKIRFFPTNYSQNFNNAIIVKDYKKIYSK